MSFVGNAVRGNLALIAMILVWAVSNRRGREMVRQNAFPIRTDGLIIQRIAAGIGGDISTTTQHHNLLVGAINNTIGDDDDEAHRSESAFPLETKSTIHR